MQCKRLILADRHLGVLEGSQGLLRPAVRGGNAGGRYISPAVQSGSDIPAFEGCGKHNDKS